MTPAGKNRSGAAPFGQRSACALCERDVFGPGLCPDCYWRFRQGLSDAMFTLGAAVAVPCAVVAAFLVLTYGQTAPAGEATPEGMVRLWRWFLPPWANAVVWQLVGSFLGAASVALTSFLLLDLPRTLRKEPRPEVHWRDMLRSLRHLRLIFEKRVTPAAPPQPQQDESETELDYRTAMQQLHDMLGIEEEVPDEPPAPMEPIPRKTIPLTSWGSTSPRMKPPTPQTEEEPDEQGEAEDVDRPADQQETAEPSAEEPAEASVAGETDETSQAEEAEQPETAEPQEPFPPSTAQAPVDDQPPHGDPLSEGIPREPEEVPPAEGKGGERPVSPVFRRQPVARPRKVHVQDSPFAQRHRIGDPLFETVFPDRSAEEDAEQGAGEFVSSEQEPDPVEVDEQETLQREGETVEFEPDEGAEEQEVVAEVDAFLDTPEVPGILTLRPTDSQELDFTPPAADQQHQAEGISEAQPQPPADQEEEPAQPPAKPKTDEPEPPEADQEQQPTATDEVEAPPEPEPAPEPQPEPEAQPDAPPSAGQEPGAPPPEPAAPSSSAILVAEIRFLSPSGTDDLPQAVTDGENMATCPGCGRRRRSPGPGRYRCSGCDDEFVIPAAVARCPRCGRERPCPPPGKYLCSSCEHTFRVPPIIACPGCGRSRPSPGEGRFKCSSCGTVFEVLADEQTVR